MNSDELIRTEIQERLDDMITLFRGSTTRETATNFIKVELLVSYQASSNIAVVALTMTSGLGTAKFPKGHNIAYHKGTSPIELKEKNIASYSQSIADYAIALYNDPNPYDVIVNMKPCYINDAGEVLPKDYPEIVNAPEPVSKSIDTTPEYNVYDESPGYDFVEVDLYGKTLEDETPEPVKVKFAADKLFPIRAYELNKEGKVVIAEHTTKELFQSLCAFENFDHTEDLLKGDMFKGRKSGKVYVPNSMRILTKSAIVDFIFDESK